MPDDRTPTIELGPLSLPFPETATALRAYIETGKLPTGLHVSKAAMLDACDRLLAHPELPKEWRHDVEAVRAELVQPFTTRPRR